MASDGNGTSRGAEEKKARLKGLLEAVKGIKSLNICAHSNPDPDSLASSAALKFLVEQGVLQQVAYRQRPLRHEYHLTDKGKDLFPWFLSLLQWGDKWCDPQRRGQPMLVTHGPCGQALAAQVRCSECHDVLRAHEVQFTLDGEQF